MKTEAKIEVSNTLDEELELSIDFSEASKYFDLSEEEVKFPSMKSGMRLGKPLYLTPLYEGNFNIPVRIKSKFGELVRNFTINVTKGVADTAQPVSPAQFTPSPTTPKTFPPELEHLYYDANFIGKGGFARVFKARRKKDGKLVVVKIPISLDEATGKSFFREMTNWLGLKHENIVELYDANILPIPFLELEFCDSSLESIPKPIEVEKAAWLIFNIAEGLKHAHNKGIVHRDLKPRNVLLKDGVPKISDWGLSKIASESSSSTVAFTPLYAAPEQVSRKFGSPDNRTDIWQLGVIFYELVTGELPFKGSDAVCVCIVN